MDNRTHVRMRVRRPHGTRIEGAHAYASTRMAQDGHQIAQRGPRKTHDQKTNARAHAYAHRQGTRPMHLRMRVRSHSRPKGAPAHVSAHRRQTADRPTYARLILKYPPLWGNGFLAFLAQSALTSHLSGPGRRARL